LCRLAGRSPAFPEEAKWRGLEGRAGRSPQQTHRQDVAAAGAWSPSGPSGPGPAAGEWQWQAIVWRHACWPAAADGHPLLPAADQEQHRTGAAGLPPVQVGDSVAFPKTRCAPQTLSCATAQGLNWSSPQRSQQLGPRPRLLAAITRQLTPSAAATAAWRRAWLLLSKHWRFAPAAASHSGDCLLKQAEKSAVCLLRSSCRLLVCLACSRSQPSTLRCPPAHPRALLNCCPALVPAPHHTPEAAFASQLPCLVAACPSSAALPAPSQSCPHPPILLPIRSFP